MKCKILLNGAKQHSKFSRLEKEMKNSIVAIAILLFLFCIFAAVFKYIWIRIYLAELESYLDPIEHNSATIEILMNVGLWFSLLSYFIPISLQVINIILFR
jgi:phospholipid-transporting ATPase